MHFSPNHMKAVILSICTSLQNSEKAVILSGAQRSRRTRICLLLSCLSFPQGICFRLSQNRAKHDHAILPSSKTPEPLMRIPATSAVAAVGLSLAALTSSAQTIQINQQNKTIAISTTDEATTI